MAPEQERSLDGPGAARNHLSLIQGTVIEHTELLQVSQQEDYKQFSATAGHFVVIPSFNWGWDERKSPQGGRLEPLARSGGRTSWR